MSNSFNRLQEMRRIQSSIRFETSHISTNTILFSLVDYLTHYWTLFTIIWQKWTSLSLICLQDRRENIRAKATEECSLWKNMLLQGAFKDIS